MPPKILIVEDDPSILRGLEMNLQAEGFETITAVDGRAALDRAEDTEPDLVILDIMLPHVNGYQVCKKLRDRNSDVPIILLSAKSAELDIVMGLDLGADDYVTKPFRVAELLARIKAHLRRRTPSSQVTFGDVIVDLEEQIVRRAGRIVEMSQREFEVLALLVDREGKTTPREMILQRVWGRNYFGTDRTVDNFITKLRHKVDEPSDPRHIRTVRGIGYRFVGDE